MSEHVKGWRKPPPNPDEGISLAGFGVPKESLDAWMHLQSFFARGETTPCAGRSEWSSSKAKDKATAIRLCGDCAAQAACLEFAETNNETGAVWGGQAR